jgi:hypothetical protein
MRGLATSARRRGCCCFSNLRLLIGLKDRPATSYITAMEDLLAELLRLEECNASLARENDVLRHQLDSKNAMLDTLQSAMLEDDSQRAAAPHGTQGRRREGGRGSCVVRANELHPEDVRVQKSALTNVHQICHGGHGHGHGVPLVVQTPRGYVPYGLDVSEGGRRHVALRFPEDFTRTLLGIHRLAEAAVADAGAEFVPSVRRDGAVRVAVAATCTAYNVEGGAMPVEACLVRDASVEGILRCNGVWHAGGRQGLSWSLLQVRSAAADMSRYAFKD